MQKLADINKCSGCSACNLICPKNCISMRYDRDGFLFPDIDLKQCIDCGKCTSICPVLNKRESNTLKMAYACKNKNLDIRMESSSGGIFTLLAEKIISDGGVVFGAAFDDEFNVHHIAIDSVCELYKMRGSKYVQSEIKDTYLQVKKYLTDGRKVLFTGVPCQIDGLLAFLGKEYDNLITQGLICHGSPSNKSWQSFLCQVKEKYPGQQIESISFRDKHSGLGNYTMNIKFKNGQCNIPSRKNPFMKAFFGNWFLRPSCYNCSSKLNGQKSDITLADFWGGERIAPEMFDGNGTSLVLVNSQKGLNLINEISEHMIMKIVDYDTAIKKNPAEFSSVKKPLFRKLFMKELRDRPFNKVVKRYYKITIFKKCVHKLKSFISR